MPDDSLLAAAKAIEAYLRAGEDFATLLDHIHLEDGDLAAKVAASISKASLAIVIPLPDLVTGAAENLVELVPVVNLFERPIVNRAASGTQIRATSVGLRVWNRLRHWSPGQNFASLEKCRLIRPDPAARPDFWQFNGRCQLLLPT